MQKAVTLSLGSQTLRGMAHVPERGEKVPCPVVILYHGFTGNKLGDRRFFWKISNALESIGIASVRYDFLGSGESDGNFEDMTTSQEIQEAHAILDAVRADSRFDATKVTLLGLSLGGVVASIVAAERSEAVRRLVLLAPAANMRDIMLRMAAAGGASLDQATFDLGGNLVGKAFADEVLGMDVYARAAAYTKSVLLIHGSGDETVSIDVSRDLLRQYGDCARLHVIEGATHTFAMDTWEKEVITQVLDFVAPDVVHTAHVARADS